MKDSITLVGTATLKHQQRDILLNTKDQYMKESNTLVGNATIKQQQKEILLNTKEQYMKESNSLADIVANNLQIGQVSQGSKGNFILQGIVQLDKKLDTGKKFHKA